MTLLSLYHSEQAIQDLVFTSRSIPLNIFCHVTVNYPIRCQYHSQLIINSYLSPLKRCIGLAILVNTSIHLNKSQYFPNVTYQNLNTCNRLLPPPKPKVFVEGMFSPLSVCGFVCQQLYAKTTGWISTKLGGYVGYDPRTNRLDFGESTLKYKYAAVL